LDKCPACLARRGTIDKYRDAIMSFWNAPLSQPNHAELAAGRADMVAREQRCRRICRHRHAPAYQVGLKPAMVVGFIVGKSQLHGAGGRGEHRRPPKRPTILRQPDIGLEIVAGLKTVLWCAMTASG